MYLGSLLVGRLVEYRVRFARLRLRCDHTEGSSATHGGTLPQRALIPNTSVSLS